MSVLTPLRYVLRAGILRAMTTKKRHATVTAPTDGDKFNLRFPPGMRAFVKAEARKKRRSMTTEILTRLEESYQAEGRETTPQLTAIQEELAALRKMVADIADLLSKK